MAGRDDVAGGKGSAADYVLHFSCDQFFVAHAVLHRADGAALVEEMRALRDGLLGVHGFGRDNAVVAARQLFSIGGGSEARGKVGFT